MAWTNVGFDGTINEAQWSALAGLLGNGYVAAASGDCAVTAVAGARSVSVAAGSLYGDGVLSTNSAPETVAMTTPVNGQWYVIALRRTWASNTAALVAIAGATTTTTTPTAPPTSFPTLNTNVGVLTDQPIAWAWCNSANTTVVVYDIRLKAVKSLPPIVANAVERDAKFMTPTQGLQVWRDDLGTVETYLGLYNASTNPGGADVAGWTSTPRQFGLVPIRPTSATIATGTGSANAVGVVSFNGATAVSLNGVFGTDTFLSYRVVVRIVTATSLSSRLDMKLRAGGTDNSGSTAYAHAGVQNIYGTATSGVGSGGLPYHYLGNLLTEGNSGTIDIHNPATTNRTTYQTYWMGWNGNIQTLFNGGVHSVNSVFDGLSIIPASGTITGQIQVFGYND